MITSLRKTEDIERIFKQDPSDLYQEFNHHEEIQDSYEIFSSMLMPEFFIKQYLPFKTVGNDSHATLGKEESADVMMCLQFHIMKYA
jgi:hypothetical protein